MDCVIRYKDTILLNNGKLVSIHTMEELNYLLGDNQYYIRNRSKHYIFVDAKEKVEELNSSEISNIIRLKFRLELILECRVLFHQRILINLQSDIDSIFRNLGFQLISIRHQNNSTNGNIIRGRKKYFYKVVNLVNAESELCGYATVKYKLPCSKLAEVHFFINFSIIIYNYECSITKEEGLLQDYISSLDRKSFVAPENAIELRKVIKSYVKGFNDMISDKTTYPLDCFFSNRVSKVINGWYVKVGHMDYRVRVNGIYSKSTKEILYECRDFFNNPPQMKVILTHGDPTLLNLGTKPVFFDFAASGYNPINADITVFIFSILLFDPYLAPIYHRESFQEHTNGFDDRELFIPQFRYEINESKQEINCQIKLTTSAVRLKLLDILSEELNEKGVSLDKNIKFFIAFRVVSVFNLTYMREYDRMYCITLMHFFYQLLDEWEDGEDLLKKIIYCYI